MLCSYQRGQPGVPDTSGRCRKYSRTGRIVVDRLRTTRTRTRASDTSSLRVDYVDRALGFASCRPDGEFLARACRRGDRMQRRCRGSPRSYFCSDRRCRRRRQCTKQSSIPRYARVIWITPTSLREPRRPLNERYSARYIARRRATVWAPVCPGYRQPPPPPPQNRYESGFRRRTAC